jgi:diguanylate cyclase (GGDEF)-like protein
VNLNQSRKLGVWIFFAIFAWPFVNSFFFSSNKAASESPQIELTDWYFCEGKFLEFNASQCKLVEKKFIEPRDIGFDGKIFTYFAQYSIPATLPPNTYAINLGPVGDEDRVWIDNSLVGETTYADELGVGFQDWKMYAIDSRHVLKGTHYVRIEVTYAGPTFGGVLGHPKITTSKFANIKKLRFNFYRSYFPFACSLALILLSLYSGLVGVFGRNKKFFYDYMGFGICFSIYIGSIGFVYTYMGFNWQDTVILFTASIIGSVYFSLRLALYSERWKNRAETLRNYIDIIGLILIGMYGVLFYMKKYFAVVLFYEICFLLLIMGFGVYNSRNALKQLRQKFTIYQTVSFLLGPIFLVSFGVDLYKQFNNAGSIFASPYALILLGFFIMLQLATEHVTALRDQELKNELEVKNQKLKYLSEHDPLTTLYNRRTFESLIEYNINKPHDNKGFSLLVLDIDHFKMYNDSYGHPAGDRMLVQFSQLLKDKVRLSDHVSRLGGEEFGIFLHNVAFDQAKNICENIRRAIETTQFEFRQKNNMPVTASVGAIHMDTKVTGVEYSTLYKVADKCLYKAKETRNKVILEVYK